MSQIVINLPHVFHPGASQVENARSLRNLLEYMGRENMAYLHAHPETPSLYSSGVVYARTGWWEPIPALYKRRKGDCKSLASALYAEYRKNGVWCRPAFRWAPRPDGSGELDYHILLRTDSGWKDPSLDLGMGAHEHSRFFGGDSFGETEFGDKEFIKKFSKEYHDFHRSSTGYFRKIFNFIWH